MRRIRGFMNLVFDAVDETTGLVERTHHGVVERSLRRFAWFEPAKTIGRTAEEIERSISRGVFHIIRTVNEVTRAAVCASAGIAERRLRELDTGVPLEFATPVQSTALGTVSWYFDYLQAALNGLFGDALSRRESPLDLGMTMRQQGHPVPVSREALTAAFPHAESRICLFVHGLTSTEWLWSLSSEDHYREPDVTFGTRLEADLGFTPIYIRYNTGRPVAVNGRALSELMTELLEVYPVPIDQVVLVGHSMGGLVARSAVHYAREHDAPWLHQLHHVVCIASPHLGSPHAKAAEWLCRLFHGVDTGATQVLGSILGARSEGIRDLEQGTIVDRKLSARDGNPVSEDSDRAVLPVDGVQYTFVAATVFPDPRHPLGRLLGDLLVRLPSATGRASESARRIPFHAGRVIGGLNHFELTSHPGVYEALLSLVGEGPTGPGSVFAGVRENEETSAVKRIEIHRGAAVPQA